MHGDETRITARTAVVGLLGHPVDHSLSPRIHNAAFRAQGVDAVYLAFDVLPEELGRAVAGLRALRMRGANVAMPHKEAVLGLLDEIDPLSARIGAVNTIINDSGRLIGRNTDVPGFGAALRSVLPSGARGSHCLLVGAGGGARAVVAALLEQEAAHVWIYNRTFERAGALCASARAWGATTCEAIPEDRVREVVRRADLIVNATSLGLARPVKEFAVPVDILNSSQVLVDLAYGSGATALVEAARAKGTVAIDGTEMLVMQAASSYRLWTGLEPPVDAMRASIDSRER
jgi:shikimate dehydrogenase